MYLFRIHIRPQGGNASMAECFEYCLNNNVLGVGWQLNSTTKSVPWEQYQKEAESIYGDVPVACKYIKRWVKEDDLVWTRDTKGQYYLARVLSGWKYWMPEEAITKDIDIANIFRVEMQTVALDLVPGKVVACFRPSRTIQEIQSRPAIEYSKYLWNTLTGKPVYTIETQQASDLFDLLDDEETEDLLFIYLQSKGWYVLPNSRKKDTMSYEFLAINPTTKQRAITQVKTGNTPLNRDDFTDYDEQVFLLQSNELYEGQPWNNITCLTRKEMLEFVDDARSWLPGALRKKLELSESIRQ